MVWGEGCETTEAWRIEVTQDACSWQRSQGLWGVLFAGPGEGKERASVTTFHWEEGEKERGSSTYSQLDSLPPSEMVGLNICNWEGSGSF